MTDPPRDSAPVESSLFNPRTRERERQSSNHSISSVQPMYSNEVETGIDSRVRSLLLSRNEHRPPRTPRTSPENRRSSVEGEVVSQLNLTLKNASPQLPSAAKRQETSSMDSGVLADDPPNLDGEISRSASDPTLVISRRQTILAEHGIDDCDIEPTPRLMVAPVPKHQLKGHSSFRIPRLILRDVEPVNKMVVRSCGSANEDDLACFIAGCTHLRRSPLEIATIREDQARRLQGGIQRKSFLAPRDITAEAKRGNVKLSQVTFQSPVPISPNESIYSQEGMDANAVDLASSATSNPRIKKQGNTNVLSLDRLPIPPSPSIELVQAGAILDPQQQSLSTVVTKFSMPDPELFTPDPEKKSLIFGMDRPLIPKNEIRPGDLVRAATFRTTKSTEKSNSLEVKSQIVQTDLGPEESSLNVRSMAFLQPYRKLAEESHHSILHQSIAEQVTASFNSKPKSPSLLSGGSRRSIRHALLKPTAAMSPTDNSLPVQPVLTQSFVPRETNYGKPLSPLFDGRMQEIAASNPLHKAKAFVSTAEKQLRAFKIRTPSGSSEQGEQVEVSSVVGEPKPHERLTGSPDNLKFWGYPPALRQGVEGAVQTAVRIAVRKIVVPPETEAEVASVAYRKILGRSLSSAVEVADIYLKRDGLWTEQAQNELSPLDSRENLMPSEAIDTHHVDPEWRSGKRCKYGASPAYAAIPARDSSRKHSHPTSKSSPKSIITSPNLPSINLPNASAEATQAPEKESSLPPQERKSTRRSSASAPKSNPTGWLRNFVGSNAAYETQFTQLPPRIKFDEDPLTIKTTSGPKLPIHVVSVISPEERPEPAKASLVAAINLSNQNGVAETFTKTINDLESLLGEALFIARQAAEKQDSGFAQTVLNNQSTIQKNERKCFEDDIPARVDLHCAHDSSNRYQRRSSAISDTGSLPSVHESLLSTSNSDASYDTQDDEDYEKPQKNEVLLITKITPPSDKEFQDTRESDAFTGKFPRPMSVNVMPGTHHTSQLIKPRSSAEQRKYSTQPIKSETTAKTGQAQHSSSIKEEIPKPLAVQLTEEVTTMNLSPNMGIQRVSTSGLSPMSRSRATTASRNSQGWAQGEEGVVYIDDRAVPESIHGPQTNSPLLSSQKGTEYVRMGNETRVESTAPSIIKSSLRSGLPFGRNTEDRKLLNHHHHSQLSIGASSYSQSYDGSAPTDAIDFEVGYGHKPTTAVEGPPSASGGVELRDEPPSNAPTTRQNKPGKHAPAHVFELKGKPHLSLRSEHHYRFSLVRSHKKPKIARDWSPGRKRFVAAVACISTALVGLLVGMYAAEVPAIQYYIVDFHHYVILGNVFFYLGLAISTFFAWPLPLLHGRKPYILGSMALAMPLLFPQALAVGDFRSPYTAKWRVALLLPRSLMGFILGFANMNFKSTLTDLFGASLMAANPHQEHVDENDVRRHGGGLGVWLGIWTWCSIGSIGTGFLIGALIINQAPPAIGFYITIAVIALVLFLNIICPEVRRSAFRRSVAEVVKENEVSRRLARGEVKMHLSQSGPRWWGEEFHYGIILSLKMLRQPGFMILAVYVAWVYGQIVMVIVLLSSLMSKYYMFKSPATGASVMAVPIGAFLAIPFQKAGFFSRDRTHAEITDDDTRDEKPGWSSHLVRRAIFVICLPFAGLGYTLTSNGPPIPFILPVLFAGLIGLLSCLAMAECHGLIMETYDTSDLQPGMTGRPRSSKKDNNSGKRTNYSSFPRVCSGFAIVQALGYCVAAIATGVGGVAERNLGARASTGVMAGILLVLSILLLLTLMRFRYVQIVPDSKKEAMERYMDARRKSAAARGDFLDDESLRPTIIGNPTHHTRRMNVLELGAMSRFSEIRRKNHLVNNNALEAKHPNLAVIRDAEARLVNQERRMMHNVSESVKSVSRALSPSGSRRSRTSFKSNFSDERGEEFQMSTMDRVVNDQRDLGGLRDMGDEVGPRSGDGRIQPGSRVTTGSGRTKRTRRKTTIQE